MGRDRKRRRTSTAAGALACGLLAWGLSAVVAGPVSANGPLATKIVATIQIGPASGSAYDVAVDPGTGTVYATDLSGSLVVIDPATDTVTARIPVGGAPLGVAVDPSTHDVYVANSASGTVSVVDGATRQVTATVAVGSGPTGVAVDGATHTVYVTNSDDGTVSEIDGTTATVVATVAVAGFPSGVAVDQATGRAYVADFVSPFGTIGNTVSVIDGQTDTGEVVVGNGPHDVAVNSATGKVYVTNLVDGTISVVDASTGTVSGTVTVPGVAGNFGPIGVDVDQASGTVWVVDADAESVSAVDPSSNTVVATVAIGPTPWGVAANSPSGDVYVTSRGAGTVTVLGASGATLSSTTAAIVPSGSQSVDTATLSGGSSPTGTLTFELFGPNDPTCSNGAAFTSPAVPVDGDGSYSSPPFAPPALGTYSWVAAYSGDASNSAVTGGCDEASETFSVVPAHTAGGSFVIGDLSAGGPTVGTSVEYWGKDWAKVNRLGGGRAPEQFQGFAETDGISACGTSWTSAPKEGTSLPATVPPFAVMVVTSAVTRSGGKSFGGDVRHLVVVQVDPPYTTSPDRPGTGTIVGVIC